MLRILFFFLLFFLSCISSSSSITESIQCKTITFRKQQFDVVHIDLRRDSLKLYWQNATGKPLRSLQKLKNFFAQSGRELQFGMNAGMYTTDEYLQKNMKVQYATQSGPMLVINEKIHPVFVEASKNLNIRNGVGSISRHELVFVISHQKVNLYDFAMLFKEKLHCANALYLDGFVSKAYIPSLERKQLGGNFGVMIGL